ncbi:mitochondrial fission ELM1 family protein [Marinobacterium sp. YM272]|uniref:mitochondrial fission ELM1 family protein n=1 Tax=Marinobacterium sp. YM272 TaxID=3421654 RepID=UPI003D7F4C9C
MKRIVIVSDGKPGHLNQSLGLAEAIARINPAVQIETLAPLSRSQALKALLFGGPEAPAKADLVIGAGHATHLTLLALKRCWRAPAVVLMKPSLPLSLFDLCLIPEHDAPKPRRNVIATRGALNRMRPGAKVAGSGMILVGGPSKHSGWDEAALISAVERVLAQDSRSWRVTSSRRTPAETEARLAGLPGLEFIPASQTPSGWLPEQLAQTECCWVTADSVSMVYEALSAGCAVGILPVPQLKPNRLQAGLDLLVEAQRVVPLARWQGETLSPDAGPLDEAGRCAKELLARGLLPG